MKTEWIRQFGIGTPRSKRGAAIIMASVYLLFVSVIATTILTTVLFNIRRMNHAADDKQADAAVTSAVRLIRYELSPLTDGTDADNLLLRDIFGMVGRIASGKSTAEIRNYRLKADAGDRTVTEMQIQISKFRQIRCIFCSVCGDSARYLTLTYDPEPDGKWKTPTVSIGGADDLISEENGNAE